MEKRTGAMISTMVWRGLRYWSNQFFHMSRRNFSVFFPILPKSVSVCCIPHLKKFDTVAESVESLLRLVSENRPA
jgi:hypothetical protein